MRRFSRHRRFWSLVDVGGPGECWPWRGPQVDGVPWYRGRGAAEWAYALARGGTPGPVTTRCGDRRCVNPDHLEPLVSGGHRRSE
jgi:hypothetical protein